MRRLLFALAALCALPATAATVVVGFTAPTQSTDGAPLPATGLGALAGVRVEYGSCAGAAFGVKAGEVTAAATATSASIVLAPATYCFRAFAYNGYGESVASNVASHVVLGAPPKPPVLVTVETTAYRLEITQNKLALVKVGTVPLKTVCDAKQTANGYYLVDRSKVKWTTATRTPAVLARCG